MRMRAVIGLGALLVGCGSAGPDAGPEEVEPGSSASTTPVATETAVQGAHGHVVAYFEGTFDPSQGTMSVTYGGAGKGLLTPQVAPVPTSGSGATINDGSNSVYMHTVGSASFGTPTCAANTLCGSVQAVNKLAVAGTFYSYIDSYSTTGITSNGPWQYLNVGANSTAAAQTWSFSDPSGTSFSFKGHVEAVFQSCSVLQTYIAGITTGTYEINPGTTTMKAYCDMATAGGGWTQVYDQKIAQGYPTKASWLAGINPTTPNNGQYSILNVLQASGTNLKKSTEYEFLFVWPSHGSLQWLQNENPMSISANTVPTGLSVIAKSPSDITSISAPSCGSFVGLYQNPSVGNGALAADGSYNCWFWAVGENAGWSGTSGAAGIPWTTTDGNVASAEAELFVR